MIEQALRKRNYGTKVRFGIKSVVALLTIAMAIVSPQLVHLTVGAQGGSILLPMYLPVLLGACLLGVRWGLAVGLCSPLFSFLFSSSLLQQAMPSVERLPFMMAELAVFALVAGAFSNKIADNAWWSVLAVISATIIGRAFYMLLAVAFTGVASITPQAAWQQITKGFIGVGLMVVVVPLLVFAIKRALNAKDAK